MAKKKTIDLRSLEPTPVPAGDVNIIYNGVRIGGFSEDTDATLKTGGTRVEHDINVNYTKPSGQTIGNTLTITNNSSSQQEISRILIIENACYEIYGVSPNTTISGYIFCFPDENGYKLSISFPVSGDNYNVSVNGEAVSYSLSPFGSGGSYAYSITSESPIAGQTYNLVISDKE